MQMRRMDRAVLSQEGMLDIVSKCKVVRLAIHDEPYPYLVALNFGYETVDGKLTFYFHSAKRGRKIDLLQKNPKVCFELDCEHALKEGEIACKYGFYYESVVGVGEVRFLEAHEEKAAALACIMRHQSGKEFSFVECDYSFSLIPFIQEIQQDDMVYVVDYSFKENTLHELKALCMLPIISCGLIIMYVLSSLLSSTWSWCQ